VHGTRHPDDLKAFIGRLAAKQAESIRVLAELGCDGVMGYNDWGLQDRLMVGANLIEEFFMPLYVDFYREVGKHFDVEIFFHCCGAVRELIPDLIDAGVTILDPIRTTAAGMDMSALKSAFGEIVPHS